MFYKSSVPSPRDERPFRERTAHTRPAASRKNYEVHRPKESEMIFGIRAVLEALDAGKTVDKILLRRDMSSSLGRELIDKLAALSQEGVGDGIIQRVPVEKLNQYTDKNHQGVIAFLSPVEFHSLDEVVRSAFERGETPLLMVLDGITDVRNFGAIARTCSCAGVHALVIGSKGNASVNGDAVKTSAGALHSLPLCKVDNLQNALQYLRDSGVQVVAATEHAVKNYTQTDFSQPTAIVMGSEDKGIYPDNLRLCSEQVRIPMAGTIESLNVSGAAGVMLYEAVRQRNL